MSDPVEPREWVLFGPLSTAHRFGPRVGEGEEVRVVEAEPVEAEREELLRKINSLELERNAAESQRIGDNTSLIHARDELLDLIERYIRYCPNGTWGTELGEVRGLMRAFLRYHGRLSREDRDE